MIPNSFRFNLKQEQESALKEFVGDRDVFVSLPTGYGKLRSVAYCLRHSDKQRQGIDRYCNVPADLADEGPDRCL